ncbi:MAG: protein-L-isoaspartate(D-aspartate) O-methyltransferase [Nitrospirae bacterium]|nr:protein-L-isoaspartate(D-aspartate) O-methyltransferase [Nitrospirota bacterium]MBF0533744.1 protein-L-isoaspartate(D-aspartate) O-methyltransferase [Nitrospirota bacterium]MBF0615547.1 protein-L-isoaspartate(D-aspartate) O-methyltransferase [Nitrospirota bacterium]
MDRYAKERERMCKEQLVNRGISDKKVLDVMLKVPRHNFVTEENLIRAYGDMALEIDCGQTISQPYMVAVMTELLELKETDRVLEIGTGSGYQAAVLSELAKEVYTIERIEKLAKGAMEKFEQAGKTNIFVKVSDGTLGLPDYAPYDKIIITAAAPAVPPPLIEQLSSDGGILVAPVGDRYSHKIVKLRKIGDKTEETHHLQCIFVPLIGAFGFNP